MAVQIRDEPDDDFNESVEPKRDKRGRFAKGSSGNPKGKKSKFRLGDPDDPASLLLHLMNMKVPVRNDRKGRTKAPFSELFMRKIGDDLLTGPAAPRLRFFMNMERRGHSSMVVRFQEIMQEFQERNEAPVWDEALEERYRYIESEYGEQWRLDEQREAFAESRREEFERFVAAREEASRPMPGGFDS